MTKISLYRTATRTGVVALALLLATAFFPRPTFAQGIVVQSGQKVAFLGDSITANGWNHPAGYVRLVVLGLKTAGVEITPVPAGISGHTSKDMLARLDRDVLRKKPDWMTLSCGVNDVWHGVKGVPLDQYKINITSIVDQAEAAGIKVMILTSTPIGEEDNANNQKLIAYNDFLRSLAPEKHCLLADLSAAMWEKLKSKTGPGNYLTIDGVHPIARGDEVMATGILQAFGLTPSQIDAARAAWQTIPGGWTVAVSYHDADGKKNARNQPQNVLRANVPLTIEQYEALNEKTLADGKTAATVINDLYVADAKALLKPAGTYDSVDALFDAGQQAAVQMQLGDQINQQVADRLK